MPSFMFQMIRFMIISKRHVWLQIIREHNPVIGAQIYLIILSRALIIDPLDRLQVCDKGCIHYCDVIMTTTASQITSLTIVYLTVYSDADQRKHQSSASLAFVRGIHRGPVNSPHKRPVTRKMFPFDDVIKISWKASLLSTCPLRL